MRERNTNIIHQVKPDTMQQLFTFLSPSNIFYLAELFW